MDEVAVKPQAAPDPREVGVLAREAAAAYRRMVEHYKKAYKLSHQEAVAKTEEPAAPAYRTKVLLGPPDQVSFFDLERLGAGNPEMMLSRWEEIKGAAREELQTGDRVAAALECFGADCWSRAQFAGIIAELIEGWQPRNGVERLLLDQMALAHTLLLDWTKTLAQRAAYESLRVQRQLREDGHPEPPRLTDAEAAEQAAAMVDRFSRVFQRTLRALRDLRRFAGPVIVQNAGQVNVGGQQVNLNRP